MLGIQTQDQNVSELCKFKENPLYYISRSCVIFLQELFRGAPWSLFKWDIDDSISKILITDESPLMASIIGKRPSIVIVRSGISFAGLGMDQLVEENIGTGERRHTDIISGNISFNCMCRVKSEAEYLGWIVGRHIWLLRRVFLKAGFHKIGQEMQISPPSPPGAIISNDTDGEIINVVVSTPFYFQWTDIVGERDLPVLNNIEANITVRMANPMENTRVLVPMLGTAINAQVPNPERFPSKEDRAQLKKPTSYATIGSGKSEPPITVKIQT
jgi:hypothetical protein